MSIKKFAFVTTALMGLYSASFASDARNKQFDTLEEWNQNLKQKSNRYRANKEIFCDAVHVEKFDPFTTKKEREKEKNFISTYKYQVNTYNNSWKGFFMNNVISRAKYVGKVFGSLFN